MEDDPNEVDGWFDESDRLVWRENERGLHLSIEVLSDKYSATGITVQSVLEVLVLELADTLGQYMASALEQRRTSP
jgi:hypothetical protein